MKYFVKTFGCQMNEADSEKIAAWYESRGWKKARTIDEADEIVINTCSVRESAEHRVMGLVNNLLKRSHLVQGETFRTTSQPKIILTGCMLYHGITTLKQKLPGVDEFKPIKDFAIFSDLYNRHAELVSASKIPKPVRDDTKLVCIMEGCNNFCTYCVVPYARGREKSRPFEEIVCEVKNLVKREVKEIILLGQNVNSYGQDFSKEKIGKIYSIYDILIYHTQTPFAALIRVIHDIPGIRKISFLTSNPWDLNDEIVEAMKLPKIDRYLHLPVQSGDNEILRKMNRHYTTKQYLELIKKIRRGIHDIKIGTDIIVGFPGETKEQFQNTVNLCKKVGFIKAYIAKYSPRPRTTAFKLKDNVFPTEKKRRWRVLENLINQAQKS